MTPKSPAGKKKPGKNPGPEIIPGAEPFEFGRGKKAILFVHGWTSSPRELVYLAEKLKSKFKCKGVLLKGHGTRASDLEGTTWKGHLEQLTDAFSDLSMKYDSIAVVGLSYGAALALHLAARRKVSGLVLLSPFLFSSQKLLKFKHESEIVPVLPKFIQTLTKKDQGPIYDKAALKNHIAYRIMPVDPLKSVIDCAHQVVDLLPRIKVPTLLIHSTGDLTSDFDSSVRILKNLGSPDKTLRAVNNSNHIITLDHDKDFVESEVAQWLKNSLP